MENKLQEEFDLDAESEEEQEEYGFNVLVNVGPCKFSVPIGDGEQDVRWLSLVASQRYNAYVKANGKQRQREGALLASGSFIPTACWSSNGKLLGAGEVLRPIVLKHQMRSAEEGKQQHVIPAEFTVELCHQVNLGEDGAPEFQGWNSQAFVKSQAGKKHIELQKAKLGPESFEETSEQDRLGSDESDSGLQDGGAQKRKLYDAPGYYSHFSSVDDTAHGLESDWVLIKKFRECQKWFPKREEVKEQEVKTILLNRFENICHLIDYYSWMYRRGIPYALSAHECRHFLHHCGFIDVIEDRVLVQNFIGRVMEELPIADLSESKSDQFSVCNSRPNISLIHRPQLLVLLMLIASHPFNGKLLPIEFARMLDEKVLPSVTSMGMIEKDDIPRRALTRSYLTKVFRSRSRLQKRLAGYIQRCFELYCIDSVTSNEEPVMKFDEFVLLCGDIFPIPELQLGSETKAEGKEGGDEDDNEEPEIDSFDNLRNMKGVFNTSQVMSPTIKVTTLNELTLVEFARAVISAMCIKHGYTTWELFPGEEAITYLFRAFQRKLAESE